MKRYTRLFVDGQAYVPRWRLGCSPVGSEVVGEPIQELALYEHSELEPAQILLLKRIIEQHIQSDVSVPLSRLKEILEPEPIVNFSGDNYFLSNFYPCRVIMEGLEYGNAEAAFQAAKCATAKEKAAFQTCTAKQAKALGRKCKLSKRWDQIKERVMKEVVWNKFQQNPELRTRLLETGGAQLIEGNRWHDNYWGDCKCPKCAHIAGENRLGEILMSVRRTLQYRDSRVMRVPLPNGKTILAEMNTDPDYPGIGLYLEHQDGITDLACYLECVVEDGQRLTVCAFNAYEEDPAYSSDFMPQSADARD